MLDKGALDRSRFRTIALSGESKRRIGLFLPPVLVSHEFFGDLVTASASIGDDLFAGVFFPRMSVEVFVGESSKMGFLGPPDRVSHVVAAGMVALPIDEWHFAAIVARVGDVVAGRVARVGDVESDSRVGDITGNAARVGDFASFIAPQNGDVAAAFVDLNAGECVLLPMDAIVALSCCIRAPRKAISSSVRCDAAAFACCTASRSCATLSSECRRLAFAVRRPSKSVAI